MASERDVVALLRSRAPVSPSLRSVAPAVVGVVALSGAAIALLVAPGTTPDFRRNLAYALLIAAAATAGVVTLVGARRGVGAQRVGWLAISGILWVNAIATAIDAAVEIGTGNVWTPSAEAWASAMDAPLVAVAAVALLSIYVRLARVRIAIDALLIGAPIFFVLWMFTLHDVVYGAGASQVASRLTALASPLGDAAFVLVIAALVVRALPTERLRLSLLLGGLIALTCGDFVGVYTQFTSPHVIGQPFNVLWLAGYLFVGIAGFIVRPVSNAPRRATDVGIQAYVPYGVVGASALIALGGLAAGRTLDAPLVCEMALMVLLLAARQTFALRENRGLTDELHASELRSRGLAHKTADVILVIDAAGVITYVSHPVKVLLGIAPERLVGRSLYDLVDDDQRDGVRVYFSDVTRRSGGWPVFDLRLRAADGTWRDLEALPNNLLGDPAVSGIVLSLRDVSERRRTADIQRDESYKDPLTKLANRALFTDRLEHALARVRRSGESVAVLIVDVDNFRIVNERHGADAGNIVLRSVSTRIRGALRHMDTAGRLDGDEFAAVLEGEVDDRAAALVARRIIAAVAEPITIGATVLRLGVSIGIAVAGGGDVPDDVLRKADVAMRRAKADGKGDYAVFSPTMELLSIARLQFEVDMGDALTNNEIVLHYQPIVELGTGTILGTEALARWQHPSRGFLPPSEFIDLAEETGQIVAIGQHVLMAACRQTKQWQDELNNSDLYVSVNVSTRHFCGNDIVSDVRGVLEETGLSSHALVIEVTESTLFEDIHESQRQMAALKKLGVRIAMDDFGTGHSSLGYLRELPVDILKIDRAFVTDLGEGEKPSDFIRAIAALARSLELTTVAEGIEKAFQVSLLRTLGVDAAQGYHLAMPEKAEAVVTVLRRKQLSLTRRAPKMQVASSPDSPSPPEVLPVIDVASGDPN